MGKGGRVSQSQQHILWEYLYANNDFALNYSRRTLAKENARMKWQEVAELLNSTGEGAVKDWKGWSRYWVELKSKIKKKNAALNADLSKVEGELPEPEPEPLTYMEKKFLVILGKNCGIRKSDQQSSASTQETENSTPGQPSTESSHNFEVRTDIKIEERDSSSEDLSEDIYAPIVELNENPAGDTQRQEREPQEREPQVENDPLREIPRRPSQQDHNNSPIRNNRRELNRDRPYTTPEPTRRELLDATVRIANVLESIVPILVNIERNTRRN